MPRTKLRSYLISACFMAYGLGNIFINVITLYIRTSQGIMWFSTLVLLLAIIPAFFYTVESPQFLFKKGKINKLGRSLVQISKKNKKDFTIRDFMEEIIGQSNFSMDEVENCKISIKIQRRGKKELNTILRTLKNFSELFTSKK